MWICGPSLLPEVTKNLRARFGGRTTSKEYSPVSHGIKKKCKLFPHFCRMLKMLGLLVGTGTALVYAGYSSMAPRSQLFGRTFVNSGAKRRELALTFDDGPNDPHTLRLAEVLARH